MIDVPISILKLPYEERLRSYAQAREKGSRSAGLVLRDYVLELLQDCGEHASALAIAGRCARQQVLVDAAAGAHGMGICMEVMLTLESDLPTGGLDLDFITTTQVVARTASNTPGVNQDVDTSQHGSTAFHSVSIRAVLNTLVTAPATCAPWFDNVAIDLLSGHHGLDMQRSAQAALLEGFIHPDTQAPWSTVRTCIEHKRFDLLRRLSDLAPPAFTEAQVCLPDVGASNKAGQWLDLLANHSNSSRHATKTSFPRQVSAFIRSPAAVVLAEIQVKHDPGHHFIGSIAGTPAHALIMQASMHSHIRRYPDSPSVLTESTSEPVTPISARAESSSRRARHV